MVGMRNRVQFKQRILARQHGLAPGMPQRRSDIAGCRIQLGPGDRRGEVRDQRHHDDTGDNQHDQHLDQGEPRLAAPATIGPDWPARRVEEPL